MAGQGAGGPLMKWLVVSTILQIVLVVAGHYSPAVLGMVPIVGTLIPLLVGLAYGMAAKISWGNAAWGGAVVGGVGALIGAAVSVMLGDSGMDAVMIATVAGLGAGLVGGLIGHAIAGRRP